MTSRNKSITYLVKAIIKLNINEISSEISNKLSLIETQGSLYDEQVLINKLIDDVSQDKLDLLHKIHSQFAIEREKSFICNKPVLDLEEIYDFNTKTEFDLFKQFLGYTPKSILIIGSGYWPKSGMYFKKNDVHVICVDIEKSCFDNSFYSGMEVLIGDAINLKFPVVDCVILTSTVGGTKSNKDLILKNVLSQKKCKVVCIREPFAEERLLFPNTSLCLSYENYDILKRYHNDYCYRRVYLI